MTQPEQEQGTAQETNDYPSEQYPEQQMQYSEQAQYPQEENIYPESFGQAYPPQYSQAYPQYESTSNETITEIAEQVVAEKFSPIRKDLEKALDLKTTFESKIEYIDEKNIANRFEHGATKNFRKVGEAKSLDNPKIEDIRDMLSSFRGAIINKRAELTGEKIEEDLPLADAA